MDFAFKEDILRRTLFGDRVVLLHLPDFTDDRGILTPIDFDTIGFVPVRAFTVVGRNGVKRGGHAHRQGSQLLVRVAGEITIDIRFGGERATVRLDSDSDSNAMLIRAPVWASQTYIGDNPILLVLSDAPFDVAGYSDTLI